MPNVSYSVGTVNMNHCYILHGNSIGVFPSNIPGTINQSNIVTSSNGSWKDSEANLALTGIPIYYDISTTWISLDPNTPYLLSSYNSEIYSPNIATSNINQYISDPGLFDSLYKIISVNHNENVSINQSNGILTIHQNNINLYTVNVISYNLDANNNYYNYNINDFNLTFQVNQATTITNFSIPTKTYGNVPFTITQPSSNSSGSFSYISSNTSVATLSGNIITIVGAGNSTITATQQATNNYTSGTITTTFQVNQATPTNPVIINNSDELLYFMNTTSTYTNITNDLEVNYDLITSNYKVLTGNNITITK